MRGPELTLTADRARWRRVGHRWLGVASIMVCAAFIPFAESEIRTLVVTTGLAFGSIGLVYMVRSIRKRRRWTELAPLARSGVPRSFALPHVRALYLAADAEISVLDQIRGREITIDGDQISVYRGLDRSAHTRPIRDELTRLNQPYLTITLDGLREVVFDLGTSGDFASPPSMRMEVAREAIVFGERALSGFNALLSPGFEREITALPVPVSVPRLYLEGIETDLIATLRQVLAIPVLVEIEE